MNISPLQQNLQWRIRGHPIRTKFFLISCRVWENLAICMLAPPPGGLAPPPTSNPASAPAMLCLCWVVMQTTCAFGSDVSYRKRSTSLPCYSINCQNTFCVSAWEPGTGVGRSRRRGVPVPFIAMVALSAVQSSTQTFIHNAILSIDTSNNWYNQVHWLIGTPYLSIIASNGWGTNWKSLNMSEWGGGGGVRCKSSEYGPYLTNQISTFLLFVTLHVSMPGLSSTAREAGPSKINKLEKMKQQSEEQVWKTAKIHV